MYRTLFQNLVVFNEASNSSSMDVDAVDSPAEKERKKENANLLETVAIWLIQYIQVPMKARLDC